MANGSWLRALCSSRLAPCCPRLREFQEEIARLKAALADAGEDETYVDENGQVQVKPPEQQVRQIRKAPRP